MTINLEKRENQSAGRKVTIKRKVTIRRKVSDYATPVADGVSKVDMDAFFGAFRPESIRKDANKLFGPEDFDKDPQRKAVRPASCRFDFEKH